MFLTRTLIASFLFTFGSSLMGAEKAEGIPVTEKIDLIELAKKGDVRYHLNPDADVADKAEEIFVVKDGVLHISGRGYGYMATNEAYRDYRLEIEFRWTGTTFGARKESARDTGILLHCHGPAGALGNTWSASIEAQIIEGGLGDILVLSPKLADGTIVQCSAEVEYELDRDKEMRWKPGAPRQLVKSGRINWLKRHEDWADKVGIRFPDDLDAPLGEWNKMVVICKGDTIQIFVNDQLVNEAFAVSPSFGPIGIQTEAAGVEVRRYVLLPLEK